MRLPKHPQPMCEGCEFYWETLQHCTWPDNRLMILSQEHGGLYSPDKTQFICWTPFNRDIALIEDYERKQGYLDKTKWLNMKREGALNLPILKKILK